ncbi:MAG: type IV pilus modification protein PilV [Gammaproteobacteria bacterium]|nr:type IV pilus modification protein PilV [Gammaproteobacteria bacterium]
MKTQLESPQSQYARPCKGFTLLEVMVALLIFSIGLLGLAGLQASGLQNNKTADLRSIAIIDAHDMAERIRANDRGRSGDYDAITPGVPTPGTDCINTTSCTSTSLIAAWDNYQWQSDLNASLPSGQGSVTRNASGTMTVTVMWDEARTGATGTSCGNNPNVDLKCYKMDFLP